jgi:hypothetical protein
MEQMVSRRTHSCALVAAMVWCSPSLAAEPETPGALHTIRGRGIEICDAYEKELNRRFGSPVQEMCRHNADFASKDFAYPPQSGRFEVTIDDLNDQTERARLSARIFDFIWQHDANPPNYFPLTDLAQWRGTKAQFEKAHTSFDAFRETYEANGNGGGFPTVVVDLNNDGKPETILYLPKCMGGGPTMVSPVVLSGDLRKLDETMSQHVLRDPIRGRIAYNTMQGADAVADPYQSGTYGVFRHRDTTYFDFAWYLADKAAVPDPETAHQVQVFRAEPGKITEVCTYDLDMPPR